MNCNSLYVFCAIYFAQSGKAFYFSSLQGAPTHKACRLPKQPNSKSRIVSSSYVKPFYSYVRKISINTSKRWKSKQCFMLAGKMDKCQTLKIIKIETPYCTEKIENYPIGIPIKVWKISRGGWFSHWKLVQKTMHSALESEVVARVKKHLWLLTKSKWGLLPK